MFDVIRNTITQIDLQCSPKIIHLEFQENESKVAQTQRFISNSTQQYMNDTQYSGKSAQEMSCLLTH